ncbi:MAG: hypothetical protein WC806_01540 [Candidatus Gracilibacteria bacterium]|jgi:hypothetical protein
MKKIFTSGLVAAVVMIALGMGVGYLFNAIFPSLVYEYNNVNIYRPWSDPLMMLYFLHPILLGFMLAWGWDKIKKIASGKTDLCKGVRFGFITFVILTIPGMLISYASFQISLLMILSWTIGSFVQLLIAGMIYAKMNK